jgi:hypothetical protein
MAIAHAYEEQVRKATVVDTSAGSHQPSVTHSMPEVSTTICALEDPPQRQVLGLVMVMSRFAVIKSAAPA